jgi:hypothetical protein
MDSTSPDAEQMADKQQALATLVQLAKAQNERLRLTLVASAGEGSEKATLFSHLLLVRERLTHIDLILKRIFASLVTAGMWQSANRAAAIPSESPPAPGSNAALTSIGMDSVLTAWMDIESLYIFANLLLDQWAISAGYITGHPEPSKITFNELVGRLEDGSALEMFHTIWSELQGELIWLRAQLGLFRSIFIVHCTNPLDRCITGSGTTGEMQLIMTSWSMTLRQQAIVDSIAEAYKDTINVPENVRNLHFEILSLLVSNMDKILAAEDRKSIIKIAKKTGIKAPSFDVFSRNLINLIVKAAVLLENSATKNPQAINLWPTTKSRQ